MQDVEERLKKLPARRQAFSGRRYVVPRPGRPMAKWKDSGSWRVAYDRFAEDDISSLGREGSRTLWNGWKNLSARREGVQGTAIHRPEAWQAHGEVEGFQKVEGEVGPICGRRYVVLRPGG